MNSTNLASLNLCTSSITDLLTLSTDIHANQTQDTKILNEVETLTDMHKLTINPAKNYYFTQEDILFKIPDHPHDQDNYYGSPRNCTIAALSDYEALHYTNFTKEQLKRICRYFNFGDN